ncbi:MAG: PepSY-like domain-containing protein [Bacteroidales bacterium]
MKKAIFSFLVGAIALVSCSKDETSTSSTTQEISVSATPSTITSYISENYPDASISSVFKYWNSDTLYTVTLNTFEFIAFDQKESPIGECLSDTLCDPKHDSIGGGHHGGGHHGGGHHGGGEPGHPGGGIPADSIPTAVAEYVAANYTGYTVHNAHYDTLCQFGIVMNVMIDSSYSAHRKLVFDASGLFLAYANRIKTNDLPTAVAAVLASNYSAYTLRDKAEVYTLADKSKQYRVFMYQTGIRLSAFIKEDGTVVCEQ